MKLKKLVTITSLLIMLLLVFSSCENKVTTTLLTIDLDYRTPLAGETVAEFKNSLSVQETWTTGKSKGLRSTDDATITEKGSTTPLKDTDTFVANKTYTVVLNYKYYDSTEKTTIITEHFTCVSQAKTVRVEYNNAPVKGDSVASFKAKLDIYIDDALTGTTTKITPTSALSFANDGQTVLNDGVNGYTLTFTYDGITYSYIGSVQIQSSKGQITTEFKSSPKVGATADELKSLITIFRTLDGVTDVINVTDSTLTLNAAIGSTVKAGDNTYTLTFKYDGYDYSFTSTFAISNNYRIELLNAPYQWQWVTNFKSNIVVYDSSNEKVTTFDVVVYKDGIPIAERFKEIGTYEYEVKVGQEVIYRTSCYVVATRNPIKIELINRYKYVNNPGYVNSNKPYNYYDTENMYGDKKYAVSVLDVVTNAVSVNDFEVYANVEFDDGSKITNMALNNSDLPGTVTYYIPSSTEDDKDEPTKGLILATTSKEDAYTPKTFKELTEAGIYSGIHDIKVKFVYDVAKGEALRSRALGSYGTQQFEIVEDLPKAFVFNTYYPVIFKDNADIKDTKDFDKTSALKMIEASVKGSAVDIEKNQRFILANDTASVAGTKLDETNFIGDFFKIANAPTLLAIPNNVKDDTEEFGYIWLRYSEKPEYLGTIDTQKGRINEEFGRYVGKYNENNTRFVFDHWNNEAETEESKKDVSKADYSVTVKDGKASDNILTAQYTLDSKTETVNTVKFVKVPVGFQFPYKNSENTDRVDTITAPFSIEESSNRDYKSYLESRIALNGDANYMYRYYGYVDKVKAIDVPALLDVSRKDLLNSSKNENENYTDEDIIRRVKETNPRSYVNKTEGDVIEDPTVAVSAPYDSGYRLVTVSYIDKNYPNITPEIKYAFRVYNGGVDSTQPMYIEINKDMTKILTPEEVTIVKDSNEYVIKGHLYASQYLDTTTVKDRLDSLVDNFEIKTSSGIQAKATDGVTPLIPTLELYEKDGTTKVDGAELIKDLVKRHYIIKATYLTGVDKYLEADYSITINNMITSSEYDKDVTIDRDVYLLPTNSGEGKGTCDLPTQKQAWYALTLQTAKEDKVTESGYAYPYFTNKTTEPTKIVDKLGKGLKITITPGREVIQLAVKPDTTKPLKYGDYTFEKDIYSVVSNNYTDLNISSIQYKYESTYVLVKNNLVVTP